VLPAVGTNRIQASIKIKRLKILPATILSDYLPVKVPFILKFQLADPLYKQNYNNNRQKCTFCK
jgi:hypothetical protein